MRLLNATYEIKVRLLITINSDGMLYYHYAQYSAYQHNLCEDAWHTKVVQFSDGLPYCPSKVDCSACGSSHLDIRYDHLHPLLRGLENMDVCFTGYGTGLTMNRDYIRLFLAPPSELKRFQEMYLEFGRKLKSALQISDSHGFEKAMILSPVRTRFIMIQCEYRHDCISAWNESGRTLEGGLRRYYKAFAFTYYINTTKYVDF